MVSCRNLEFMDQTLEEKFSSTKINYWDLLEKTVICWFWKAFALNQKKNFITKENKYVQKIQINNAQSYSPKLNFVVMVVICWQIIIKAAKIKKSS